MKVTKLLGLVAAGSLLALAVPGEHAHALSLNSPGAAAAVQDAPKQMSGTTEVRWHSRRHHRWHRPHPRRHWRR
ncbi:hypothetical protein [Bradyrhizobium neotropicale]|uniref:hypothetical protein n=1 Tax=Bradyrhizobium neotropicale TaxID=1497615 RepID=UPI001AD6FBDE|nr:hypothetical protein [Bradyrhizobium neotropicale]MBO4227776.1 hypothetical protein [Bradyrhizobium neotropicale]